MEVRHFEGVQFVVRCWEVLAIMMGALVSAETSILGRLVTPAFISLCTRAMSDELKAPFKAQAQFENDQYKDKMARWNSGKCIGGNWGKVVPWGRGARHAMIMMMMSLWSQSDAR